jgi:hypothetical protein
MRASSVRTLVIILGAAFTYAGCLGEPPVEKRWTLLELQAAAPTMGDPFAAGGAPQFTVQAKATYREIFSGFLVAELRYSDSLAVGDVFLDPHTKDKHLDVARAVDRVLQSSVTAGRNAKAVVGFDHLMQQADLSFTAFDPRGRALPGYGPVGSNGTFFLLLYLAHGDKVELPSGRDTLLLDPVLSTDLDVLSTGVEILPAAQ